MGTVLRAFLSAETCQNNEFQHVVVTLEALNSPTQACLDALGIAWWEQIQYEALQEVLLQTDLVLLHWWNHPHLMQTLARGLPPCRLAIWSHVNGYYAPQAFFPELFSLPDQFIFASAASLEAPVVTALSPAARPELHVIQSCAGIPAGAECYCPKTTPFQIGYIGTVEPAKMHPEFLNLCAAADLKQPCVVAGGPAHETLQAQAQALGLASRFQILGPVADPRSLFQSLHVLAYPLTDAHYGTGEQVLIEALAFGAVPVVLDHPPERALIRDGETGLIARSGQEFSAALRYLSQHPQERERMARAGFRYVQEVCPMSRTQQAFHQVFKALYQFPRRPRQLRLPEIAGVRPGSPFHLYLSACGPSPEREAALALLHDDLPPTSLPPSFRYLTRGAPAHYLAQLGPDPALAEVCRRAQAGSV